MKEKVETDFASFIVGKNFSLDSTLEMEEREYSLHIIEEFIHKIFFEYGLPNPDTYSQDDFVEENLGDEIVAEQFIRTTINDKYQV